MRKILVSLLLVLGLASPAWAAIVCSDPVEFATTSVTDPETIAYTTPAGSNQITFVGVSKRGADSITQTVTQAGNALTAVAAQANQNPVNTQLLHIVNPTSGTNNVVVDFSSAPLTDGIVIFTCSGVNTADPIRAFNSASGVSTAPSVTVAGVEVGDVVVDMMGADQQNAEPTEGANQTVLHKGQVEPDELGYGSSQQAGADGGAMTWSIGVSNEWVIMAAALKPAVAAPILQQPQGFLPLILGF